LDRFVRDEAKILTGKQPGTIFRRNPPGDSLQRIFFETIHATKLYEQTSKKMTATRTQIDAVTMDRIYGKCKAIAGRKLRGSRAANLDSDDIAQEVAIAWINGYEALEWKADRIARNATAKERAAKRGGNMERQSVDVVDCTVAQDASPLLRAMQAESAGALHAALEQLEPDVRDVVRMRFFEGMEYQDIAEAIGLNRKSVQSVFNRLEKGLSMLRGMLSE